MTSSSVARPPWIKHLWVPKVSLRAFPNSAGLSRACVVSRSRRQVVQAGIFLWTTHRPLLWRNASSQCGEAGILSSREESSAGGGGGYLGGQDHRAPLEWAVALLSCRRGVAVTG